MPEVRLDDTICAIATASGEAALSIVRLSGPRAIEVADKIFCSRSKRPLMDAKPFTIHYGHLLENSSMIDECLVSVFHKPRSFTAEDMVEISVHGGTQVARKVIELCGRYGARVAEPGEFTKRAFLNGRIDLVQAEAVVDIIRSQSEQGLRQALSQLEGFLSAKVKTIKERLLRLLAHVEAYIDFPEEDHDVFSSEEFEQQFDILARELECLLNSYRSGCLIRNGILCAIIGRPNVGKSSLMNALIGSDRAIVTAIPGTTRDSLEESCQWHGVAIRLVDTAGLSTPRDELDRLGMERTRKYIDSADLYLWVLDSSETMSADDLRVADLVKDRPFIAVLNKCDLPLRLHGSEWEVRSRAVEKVFCSALKGEGLEELKEKIVRRFTAGELKTENVHLTRERHRDGVEKALEHLREARKAFGEKVSLEFLATDLRAALSSLSELTGEVYTDDLLSVIFREFCVGK